MKWNYETNLPVEGSYKRISHNPVRVKEILNEYEEMAGTKEMMPWIESVNYDPDEFLLQKLYKNIPDVVPAQFITLLAFQFDAKPFLKRCKSSMRYPCYFRCKSFYVIFFLLEQTLRDKHW